MSAFMVEDPKSENENQSLTRRQIFYASVIVTAVLVLITVVYLFISTGGHDTLEDELVKLISPAVKQRFAGFKDKFGKVYANQTEEKKRLIIFDQNLKEMYKRSKQQHTL